MTSEFNGYLDDGSLGGHVSSFVMFDSKTIRGVGPSIDLVLNQDKCEIVTDDISVAASMKALMPNIRHIPCSKAIPLHGCSSWR